MKVYIGPYGTWIGPYQIAEKLLFWMDKEDDRITKLGDKLDKSWVGKLCNWIDSKKKRKVNVRIDNYDTWSMDNTLAYIVLPMLKQLRSTKHGSPFTDDEDAPENLRSTAAPPRENEWDTDGNHHKRWEWIMDEMIYAFEMEVKGNWDMEIWSRGGDSWNEEKMAERDLIQKRIDNGFRLFGKYYQALWD